MGLVAEQVSRIAIHLKERGLTEAWNYAFFRVFYGVHSPFISKFMNIWAPYPPYIEVEVTTKCNLRCLMCEHTYWHEPSRDMSYDQFLHIMQQFPRLKWIGLTGIGESFLNKDFMKMIEYCKHRKIYVEIFDTFFYWDKEISYRMVDLGLNRALPSFDAATEKTYKLIRANSDFNRVVAHLRSLFEAKSEKSRKLPEVCFHYIVSKANIDEMSLYLDLIRDIAGDQPVEVQYTEVLSAFKEVEDQLVQIPDSLMHDVEKKSNDLKIKLHWNRNTYRKKPQLCQCTLWTMPFIFVTGDVIPCCGGNEANRRDFQKETSLGNVFVDDFRTIWKGKKYGILRSLLRENTIPAQCRNCPSFRIS